MPVKSASISYGFTMQQMHRRYILIKWHEDDCAVSCSSSHGSCSIDVENS